MTDALRTDRTSQPRDVPGRGRDARVEQLLLAGLDHYFAGQYELAINVWTRVLFLDRGHARARAYIERARSAVAEEQREADELLHAGAAALARGDLAAARQLLTSAVERGSDNEKALALLQRIDRLDAAASTGPAPESPAAHATRSGAEAGAAVSVRSGPPARPRPGDPRIAWLAGGVLAGVLLAMVAAGYLWIVAAPIEVGPPAGSTPPGATDPLPVPSPGEIRILRARDLAAKGYLYEALRVLDGAVVHERDRRATDELRAAIQRRLLDAVRQPPASSAPSSAPGTPGVAASPTRSPR